MLLAIVFPLVAGCGSEEEVTKEKASASDEGFDLQGAIELFEKSKNPEDFEKSLNIKGNAVNNLDLNDDGKIDFVKVIDRKKGDSHSIVMQAVLSEKENQDVAAIMIQKNGPSTARLQIVGNEVLYGKEVVMEPIGKDAGETKAMLLASNTTIVVNVWAWPIVRHVYHVHYVPYVSPVRWEVYPVWYHPHHHHHKHHGKGHAYGHYKHHYDHAHYRVVPVCELTTAHNVYIANRENSVAVSIRFGSHHHRPPYSRWKEPPHHHDKHHDKHFDKHHGHHRGPGGGNGHHDKKWDHPGDKHEKGKPHNGFKSNEKQDKGPKNHDLNFERPKHEKGPKHEMKPNRPQHEKGGNHNLGISKPDRGGPGGGKPDHGGGGKGGNKKK